MVHAHCGLTTEKSYTLVRAFSDLEEARLGPWYGRRMEEWMEVVGIERTRRTSNGTSLLINARVIVGWRSHLTSGLWSSPLILYQSTPAR